MQLNKTVNYFDCLWNFFRFCYNLDFFFRVFASAGNFSRKFFFFLKWLWTFLSSQFTKLIRNTLQKGKKSRKLHFKAFINFFAVGFEFYLRFKGSKMLLWIITSFKIFDVLRATAVSFNYKQKQKQKTTFSSKLYLRNFTRENSITWIVGSWTNSLLLWQGICMHACMHTKLGLALISHSDTSCENKLIKLFRMFWKRDKKHAKNSLEDSEVCQIRPFY